MDSQEQQVTAPERTAADQAIYDTILAAIAQSADSLGPMGTVVVELARGQVESVSPLELRAFLASVRDQIDDLLTPVIEGEAVMTTADAGFPSPSTVSLSAPPVLPVRVLVAGSGGVQYAGAGAFDWYDPAAEAVTDREPTPEDGLALVDALETASDPARAQMIEHSAAIVLRRLQAAASGR